MGFEIKEIVESGRADNMLYVYKQLRDLDSEFVSRARSLARAYRIRLPNIEEVINPDEELKAMVTKELAISDENLPFLSKFFSSMLVSDILIEAELHFSDKYHNPTKNPNTDRLIDITDEEMASYMTKWGAELDERKRDD